MKLFFVMVRICLSGLLLWLFMKDFDFSSARQLLLSSSGKVAFGVIVIVFLCQSVIGGIRLRFVMQLFKGACSSLAGLRIWLIGLFVSQTMATIVAGDAVRAWQLSQEGVGLRTAAGAILFDRLVGFVILLLLVLVGVPFLLGLATNPSVRNGIVALALGSVAALLAVAASSLVPHLVGLLPSRLRGNRLLGIVSDLASVSRHVAVSWSKTILIAALSLMMHFCNILAVYIVADNFRLNADLWLMAVVVLPVILISLLPISFAGWGVREGAMVIGLGLIDVPMDKAVAVSVTFGLALLVSSLPGAVLIVANRWNKRREALETKSRSVIR